MLQADEAIPIFKNSFKILTIYLEEKTLTDIYILLNIILYVSASVYLSGRLVYSRKPKPSWTECANRHL